MRLGALREYAPVVVLQAHPTFSATTLSWYEFACAKFTVNGVCNAAAAQTCTVYRIMANLLDQKHRVAMYEKLPTTTRSSMPTLERINSKFRTSQTCFSRLIVALLGANR